MSAIIGDYVESTQGRAGTPDGNVFFDTTNGKLEFFFDDEVAQIDYGNGLEANKLTASNRPTLATLYAFERARRGANETLRNFDVFLEGSYKRAGAYNFVFGREFSTVAEKKKVDASGWNEIYTTTTPNDTIKKKFYGAISLGNIETTSQPFYKFADGVPINFARTGSVSEAVEVFEESVSDERAVFEIGVRTFGYSFSSKSLLDLPYDTSDADIGGFAISEAEKKWITDAGYTFDNVYTTPQAPFDGMEFAKLSSAVLRTGFAGVDKNFTYVLENIGAGTVQEVMAKLDALSSTDDNINTGTNNDASIIHGKRESEWYSVDASGRLVTKQGLFIDGLPATESQKIVQTSDDGTECIYAYYPIVEILVGANAKADVNCWYQVYYKDGDGDLDFNKDTAVTVQDKDGNDVKGLVSGADVTFAYDYVNNNQAGLPADSDKIIIVEVEGNGTATFAKTEAIIKKQDVNSITCSPSLETN